MGPTASGKTELAEGLANHLGAQLVNADAFQIYRGMDIGTAKPENHSRYRLLDIRNPSEGFGVGEYVALAQAVLEECWEAQRNVVVVGGTGLYVRALFEEYDDMGQAPPPEIRSQLDARSLEDLVEELTRIAPETASRVDSKNRVRVQRALERIYSPTPSVPLNLPPFQKQKFAVNVDTEVTAARITRRVDEMIEKGWIGEVAALAANGFSLADPGLRAIGYEAIWRTNDGEVRLEDAKATVIAETRRYAKRQRTWLRSEPHLYFLDSNEPLRSAMDCLDSMSSRSNLE